MTHLMKQSPEAHIVKIVQDNEGLLCVVEGFIVSVPHVEGDCFGGYDLYGGKKRHFEGKGWHSFGVGAISPSLYGTSF